MEQSASRSGDSAPITFESLNLKRVPVRVQVTRFGKIRAISNFEPLEWIYLSVSILALTATFGLTVQRLVNYKEVDSSDFTFGVLLIITTIFCAYYVVHAMFTERGDELAVFVVSNVIVLIYCVANYVLQQRTAIKLARLVIVCVMSSFLLVVGIYQALRYCRSNNLIVNTVGTLPHLQQGCKMFYWCSSLLKFDLQLQLNMVILVMGPQGAHMDLKQAIILGTGVLITVVFITLGFLGLRKENQLLMAAFYVFSMYEPVYIIYKFYYVVIEENKTSATFASTFACGSFALVVWVAVMISTGNYVSKYFGIGLKENMFENVNSPQPVLSMGSSEDEDQRNH